MHLSRLDCAASGRVPVRVTSSRVTEFVTALSVSRAERSLKRHRPSLACRLSGRAADSLLLAALLEVVDDGRPELLRADEVVEAV